MRRKVSLVIAGQKTESCFQQNKLDEVKVVFLIFRISDDTSNQMKDSLSDDSRLLVS
ncbi:hypothetical protein [Listeria monocytogenes]|uniref:hypothetical protein n=1 Tax=Listeria monocytogenes TaxID=1639 RepID=UPI001BE41F7C|nr:hypothetical protein [Listeria monocytogenes]